MADILNPPAPVAYVQLFVVQHAPTGDVLRRYKGMSQDVVSELVTADGFGFEFLTEADFNAKLAALPKIP